MTQHSATLETLLALFAILLLLLATEYYILVSVELDKLTQLHVLIRKGIKLVLKAGLFFRITTILTYTGLVSLMIKSTSSMNNPPQTKQGVAKVAFSIFLSAISGYVLWNISTYEVSIVYYLYPLTLLGIFTGIPLLLVMVGSFSSNRQEQSEKRKIEHEESICIPTRQGYVNVPNPYRGILIVGSSGSGKSVLGNTILHQLIEKDFCGVVYDFKFPTLANEINTALHGGRRDNKRAYYIINFQEPGLSHRCNPLSPENISTLAHAEEYAKAIVNNLDTNTIRHRDFFSNSAIAWLASLIWFYRCEHPAHCTLPHVINSVLYQDYTHVISMLETHTQSADMVRSISTAIINKAEKQKSRLQG